MAIQIHTIPFGMVNCYLLKGEKSILVDAGIPNGIKVFSSVLKKTGIHPEEIELVVLTHGHMDHIGTAKSIKALTGAQIAIHQLDQECLETGFSPVPPGTTFFGKILSYLGSRIPQVRLSPTCADILLGDEDFSLVEYGIPGKVIYTPGHSMGSVSVLLESGEAFVGDLAMSAWFMRWGPGLPIFADDLALVLNSWKKVVASGAQIIYPAHGKPFSADAFRDGV